MLFGLLMALTTGISEIPEKGDTTTVKSFSISGFVDTYYGSSLYTTEKSTSPYFVSSAKNNQANINLIYLDAHYQGRRFRFNLAPATGTYMKANYAAEKGLNKYLFEANGGFLISRKMNIWIDGGVLESPFSSESALSKDQLLYSRSFAPENVPYYLNGVRLSASPHSKWTIQVLRLNGWQQIKDVNEKKSFAGYVSFKPSDAIEFTYNSYVGDERSALNPSFRTRIFHDVYTKFYSGKKWEGSAGFYLGTQRKENGTQPRWWQANLITKRNINERVSVSGRIEYFSDPEQVLLRPENNLSFKVFSSGLCLNLKLGKKSLFRIDGRYFKAADPIFNHSGQKSQKDLVVITSLSSWF